MKVLGIIYNNIIRYITYTFLNINNDEGSYLPDFFKQKKRKFGLQRKTSPCEKVLFRCAVSGKVLIVTANLVPSGFIPPRISCPLVFGHFTDFLCVV